MRPKIDVTGPELHALVDFHERQIKSILFGGTGRKLTDPENAQINEHQSRMEELQTLLTDKHD